MDKVALLDQLKIERETPRTRPVAPSRRGVWIAAAAAILVGASGTWFLVERPDLVRVSLAPAKPLDARTAQPGSLLDASGYVVARRQATVSAKVAGKVSEVLIQEGEHVQAGQVLARLDASNAQAALAEAVATSRAAEAAVRMAQASSNAATGRYDRLRRLQQGFVSEQALADEQMRALVSAANLDLTRRQLESAQARVQVNQQALYDTVVLAPFAGVVTARSAQPGEIVAPVAGGGFTRTGICTIVDMDSLEVLVDVSESFISRVTPGASAQVTLDAYPDWAIPARVTTVIPTAERAKATVTVRVELKARDPRIIPEMGARVAFLTAASPSRPAAPNGVLAPPGAVRKDPSGQTVVFVVEGSRAKRRAVRMGDRSPQGDVILGGLRAGEVVAIGGGERLRDGTRVRATAN